MPDIRDFLLPDLGEGLTEGEILQWLVAVGDRVTVDQPIAEVSTEKAAVEVPTPFAGVVVALHGQPGDVRAVGTPLISVDVAAPVQGDAETAAADAAAATGSPSTDPADVPTAAVAPPVTSTDAGAPAKAGASGNVLVGYGTSEGERRRRRVVTTARSGSADGKFAPTAPTSTATGAVTTPSSPLVRRLARELDVDLAQVTGTGPGGAVTRADLESFHSGATAVATPTRAPAAAAPPTLDAPPPGPSPAAERIPLRGPRRLTAERLSRSHAEVPTATCWLAADATRVLELRDLVNQRQQQVHVTPLAVLLRLVVASLQRYPLLNSSFDAEHGEIAVSPAIHLGVATQTSRGLVVPVIRDAQQRSVISIAAELSRLAVAARDSSIDAAELRGSTITVSNFGAFGVDGGIPIINPPEAAILGVGRIAARPWIVDGAVTARPVIELSLAFDHRVCDGGDAGGFLRLLGDYLEQPGLALAEG